MQLASNYRPPSSLSAEDLSMASDSRDMPETLDVGNLGSFAFSMDAAKQVFDDEDLQMLVYTGTGIDGEEVSAHISSPGPPSASFLGWSASVPKDGPESNAQPIPSHPLNACDSFVRGSDNHSVRSSAPSVYERNSSGRQSTGQLPILHGTYSNDHESLGLDREGSIDDGSNENGSGCKKRVRNSEVVKNKRLPGTTRGPFHPSGPCLLTDMTEEYQALDKVLAMSSFLPLEIAEEAADQVYVPKRGKGGRNPALDARLDPNIDPKKAARIMANRLSAARSKMRRKMVSQTEGLQSKLVLLESQKHRLEREVERLDKLCRAMEVEVYGKGVAGNRILGEGGILKGSAGIAFEIDFGNPMGSVPMNFGLPPASAPPEVVVRHQHSSSWSAINSAFNNNVDAFNNHGNVEGWQPQGNGGFNGNMLHLGGLVPDPTFQLQPTKSMPQASYFGP